MARHPRPSGLQEPLERHAQSGDVPKFRVAQGETVQGFHRRQVCGMRQPGDGSRSTDRSLQDAARGQPDGAAAHGLDAARAHAQEYRSVLQRSRAGAASDVGRRMGESLVARGIATEDSPRSGGMSTVTDRRVSVWQNKIRSNVKVAGSGPPVVFLHGAGGLVWDPFLESLAAKHTVYAPEHPGLTEGEP